MSNTFWNDEKVRAWAEDTRHLALYLLTNEQRTAEGFYGLPIGLMCDDLKWTPERTRSGLAEVERTDFARYDETARVVLIRKALKYHPPKGIKSIRGAVAKVDAVHGSPELFELFVSSADKYAADFAAELRRHYGLESVDG